MEASVEMSLQEAERAWNKCGDDWRTMLAAATTYLVWRCRNWPHKVVCKKSDNNGGHFMKRFYCVRCLFNLAITAWSDRVQKSHWLRL